MRTLAIIIMMIFGTTTLFCQFEDPGAWYSYHGNWMLNKNWSTKVLVQYRSQSINPHLDKVLIWGGFYYQKEQSPLMFGMYYYQLDDYLADETERVPHHMIYNHYLGQEVKYTNKWKGITLTPKLRLEQVWKPDKAVYLQSRLGLSFKLPYKKWAVKGYNETFIMVSNLNYNRNRIYTGIARKITNNFQLELGVMSERFVEDTKNYFIFQVMTMM